MIIYFRQFLKKSPLKYKIEAHSEHLRDGHVSIKQSKIDFGTTPQSAENLPNPAELFLGAFGSCMLKNVERFSQILNFDYSTTRLEVIATRLENPPRMDEITYRLTIYSEDSRLNTQLLKKNIEKYGTIYNTVKLSCSISGTVVMVSE